MDSTGTSTTTDLQALTARTREHLARLCGCGPDRFPGTAGNQAAVDYVAAVLGSLGLTVERLPFEVARWARGPAKVAVGEQEFTAFPSPFSLPVAAAGRLTPVAAAVELGWLEERGTVLLLHGEIASCQLVPRGYPWYQDPDDSKVYAQLERVAPVAILAATGKYPPTTGALSPFPLIEDVSFPIPSAYLDERTGRELVALAGEQVRVTIRSGRESTRAEQPVARLSAVPDVRGEHAGAPGRRILVTAHLDTKPDTPGAIDNAAGVAVLLAVAELLAGTPLPTTVEFVPFNGEDHAASPGEVAYLAAHPALDDLALVINIDAAGSPGGPTVVSRFATTPALDAIVDDLLQRLDGVTAGEPWWASDHAIFAMQGVPSLALTSHDLERLCEHVTHTTADTPDQVDPAVLATAARFVAAVVRAVG